MSTLPIETLPLPELKQLRLDLEKVISMKEHREKLEAHARLETMAQEMGFKLGELVELAATATKPKGTRAKALRKYRNPQDPSTTWSGRGRQPAWFTEALEAGKSPEELVNEEALERGGMRRQA
jgi:DNA-binding protein H-NS